MKTILVIDDEPFMLELVRKILEPALYRVVTATMPIPAWKVMPA